MNCLHPGQPVPDLSVNTVAGGRWNIADQVPERFTMIVFYRGLHSPDCRRYLRTLDEFAVDFRECGVEPFAVSGDSRARAREAQQDWRIENISIGYELPEDTMRCWGLFISRSLKVMEPDVFCEPGVFLVQNGGTLFFAAITNMPFGRPDLIQLAERLRVLDDRAVMARGTA